MYILHEFPFFAEQSPCIQEGNRSFVQDGSRQLMYLYLSILQQIPAVPIKYPRRQSPGA